jgi:hypothetical protein
LLLSQIQMQLHLFFEVGAKLMPMQQHAETPTKLSQPVHCDVSSSCLNDPSDCSEGVPSRLEHNSKAFWIEPAALYFAMQGNGFQDQEIKGSGWNLITIHG